MAEPHSPTTPTFLITTEYQRFTEFCDACRRYRYIGLCYGPSGVGKTLSARRYARWDQLEPVLLPYRFPSPPTTHAEVANCRTILYTPSVTTTPKRLGEEIDALSGALNWAVEELLHPDEPNLHVRWQGRWTELLLVDEADRLKLPALEELRDRYDRGRLGLVLIGMPGIEKRLARYAQFYSRVGFVHQFRVLSGADLPFVLAYQWQQLGLRFDPESPSDAAALAATVRITGGNFRLIQRLFAQIERVLEINQLYAISTEVVDTARESLVIGPLS